MLALQLASEAVGTVTSERADRHRRSRRVPTPSLASGNFEQALINTACHVTLGRCRDLSITLYTRRIHYPVLMRVCPLNSLWSNLHIGVDRVVKLCVSFLKGVQ